MKVELKKLPQSRISLTIELASEEFESYLNEAASELGRTLEIKGFRPGHAPRRIIEENFGKDRILHRATELAMRQSYVKAVLEQGLETVEEPALLVAKANPGEPFVFRAEVTVLPEVKLGDYTQIPVSPVKASVTEEEVDSALRTLQKSRASYTTVSRPAQKGDRIEIDFETTVEGKPVSEGKSSQHPLILGEGHFLKGFEEKLIGLKEGQKKTFSLKADQDYHRPELAGKKVDFSVKIELVQAVELPELNDEFARAVGRFSSLEEFKESISAGLLEEKKNREREKMRLKIIEVLIERSAVEIPEVLLKAELAKMEGEFVSSLERIGIDKDSYLAHLRKNLDDLRKEWRGQAEKRVRAALILRQIAGQEGIAVSDEEIEGRINELLRNIPNPEEAQKIDLVALQNYLRGIIRNEKVFELLEKNLTN